MAKLASAKKAPKNAKPGVKITKAVETPEEIVGQDAPSEKYMTEAEAEVLKTSADEIVASKTKVSTEKMEKAVDVIQDTFNLADKGYVVNSFTDGGTKLKLSLANSEFEIAVTIKDAEKHGLL